MFVSLTPFIFGRFCGCDLLPMLVGRTGSAEFDPSPPCATTDRIRYVKVKTLEEVVEISDRILVIGRGRSLGVLEGESCTMQRILELAFGVEQANEAA